LETVAKSVTLFSGTLGKVWVFGESVTLALFFESHTGITGNTVFYARVRITVTVFRIKKSHWFFGKTSVGFLSTVSGDSVFLWAAKIPGMRLDSTNPDRERAKLRGVRSGG
jgi:hypothetical protein